LCDIHAKNTGYVSPCFFLKGGKELTLEDYGWDSYFETEFHRIQKTGYVPARVCRVEKDRYFLHNGVSAYEGVLSGKFRSHMHKKSDLPTIGDWVVLKKPSGAFGLIETLLKRKNALSRKTAGAVTEEQLISANVDAAMIFSALDQDLSIPRIERYLLLCAQCAIESFCVFNKLDLCSSLEEAQTKTQTLRPEVKRFFISVQDNTGLSELLPYFGRGKTVVLLGSSGVGKTSFINTFAPNQSGKTQEVRITDHKGKHTTTWRELVLLPEGGLLVDNPGMREVQLWADKDALEDAFEDILAFESTCRFRNCSHLSEPGCAVLKAVEDGQLSEERLENYRKLKTEINRLSVRRKEVGR
jgi:ribosome biogenesis GTPase